MDSNKPRKEEVKNASRRSRRRTCLGRFEDYSAGMEGLVDNAVMRRACELRLDWPGRAQRVPSLHERAMIQTSQFQAFPNH